MAQALNRSRAQTSVKSSKGRSAPLRGGRAPTAKGDPKKLVGMYRDMLLIRRFEEKAGQLYGQGLIAGFCHLYIGQEAVVVGMQSTITPADSAFAIPPGEGNFPSSTAATSRTRPRPSPSATRTRAIG